VKNKIKVIQDVPGSGKTTLIKCIMEKWLKVGDMSWTISGVIDYDLIVFVECRTNHCQNFGELIKYNFPRTLASVHEEKITETIGLLNILVLIDGYDERRNSSERLLSEIIDSCKYHNGLLVIFTTRPLAGNILLEELAKRELNYDLVTIE
jgi:hypothetical protein